MKPVIQKCIVKCFLLKWITILSANNLQAQNCPPAIATKLYYIRDQGTAQE
jgi:hypothetical protein